MTTPERPPTWPYHPWYRLARRRMALAAEVPASRLGRRARVAVYPSTRGPEAYYVQHFELALQDLEKVRAGDDVDAYWIDYRRLVASNMDELRAILAGWLDDLNRLVQPVFCEYPA